MFDPPSTACRSKHGANAVGAGLADPLLACVESFDNARSSDEDTS
jgi:hypothetical protein